MADFRTITRTERICDNDTWTDGVVTVFTEDESGMIDYAGPNFPIMELARIITEMTHPTNDPNEFATDSDELPGLPVTYSLYRFDNFTDAEMKLFRDSVDYWSKEG